MLYRYYLPNGLQVVSEPMANRKTVALGVFVKVGSQDETKENNGISHLVEHMFFKGTKTRSAKDIADLTARIGDDVNAFTSKECTALYGMTVTKKFGELAMLLGDLLTNPQFDAKELAKEKRIVMDEIDMYWDSPEDLVHELLQKRVWKNDSLGYLISGTKSVVRSLKREELHQFLRGHYYAENMLISVAGGYEEKEVKSILADAFSGVKSFAAQADKKYLSPEMAAVSVKRDKAAELALPPYHAEYMGAACFSGKKQNEIKEKKSPCYYRSFAVADKDIEQLHLNLAFPAPCLGDKRRFAYSIMNSAFGGSNNSRLFQQIREEAGMAYSVYSYSSAYLRAGLFHIDITVQPQLAVPVLSKVAGIVEEFSRCGLTEEELSLHKEQVETELIMGAESPKTRMDANAKYALAGTKLFTLEEKLELMDAVTCGQIKELAEEILKLREVSLCVVGNREHIDLNGIRKLFNRWGNMGQNVEGGTE